jgi:hypothetical protein
MLLMVKQDQKMKAGRIALGPHSIHAGAEPLKKNHI